jgi:hypothetical protein
MMTVTAIFQCTCKHAAQDKLHGKGNRVFNAMTKRDGWRCTVCKREKMNN